jgi:predicted N-acetyltransferase YhbS
VGVARATSTNHHVRVAQVLVRAGAPDDFPAMSDVFRRASLSNDGDRELLAAHPEFLEYRPPPSDVRTFVATDHGRVVGFACAARRDEALELVDLFVDPEQMRTGIGSMLVDAIVGEAHASGCSRVDVDANLHSVGFYIRVGFGVVREIALEHGTAVRMSKDVPS